MIQVVWFKRDLRTCDHAPLAAAAAAGPVLPLYVVEPDYWHLADTSTRQWVAQRAALVELSQRLSELGAPLIVRVGTVVKVLERIHSAMGIARLLAHQETGNLWTFGRDIAVRGFCERQGITFAEFSQTGVIRGAGARDRSSYRDHPNRSGSRWSRRRSSRLFRRLKYSDFKMMAALRRSRERERPRSPCSTAFWMAAGRITAVACRAR